MSKGKPNGKGGNMVKAGILRTLTLNSLMLNIV